MARPSQAALEAASAFQAPLDVPPKRKHPGSGTGVQLSSGVEERQKNTRDTEETQGAFTDAFLSLLDADSLDVWLLPGERPKEPRGAPVPTFDDVHEEAKLWASWATLPELRAYMAAIWNALPQYEQAAFLAAVGAGVVA